MNKLLKREDLDVIKKENPDKYQREIVQEWETQAEDIAKIKAIIASYEQSDRADTLMVGDKPFPRWALDAYEFFTAKYGTQYGSVIYEKVLSKVWGEINIDNTKVTKTTA
tara:strand:+ start:36136 stop:36465 length:330 start_codon:yes stop_codon:yes gene_type:complete